MAADTERTVRWWSPENIERLREAGCGRINCGSRLEIRNPVEEEIRRIIAERFNNG